MSKAKLKKMFLTALAVVAGLALAKVVGLEDKIPQLL
jgi:hypothetical protein